MRDMGHTGSRLNEHSEVGENVATACARQDQVG